MFNAPGHSSH